MSEKMQETMQEIMPPEELPEFMEENGFHYRLHPERQVYYMWQPGEPWPPEESPVGLLADVPGITFNIREPETEMITPKRWGSEWMDWMKTEHPEEYRRHMEEGTLRKTALSVDDMVFELMDAIEKKELAKITLSEDIMEQTRQRNQIRDMAIEIARAEIIHQEH